MIPRSISASALNTAELCLARYKAENIDRAPRGRGGDAALLGTTVHGALEMYVKMVYLDQSAEPDRVLLSMCYRKSYLEHFGDDVDTDWFRDGAQMIEEWFDRNDFKGFTVISCEIKETFDVTVPDSSGTPVTVPFNYIWDRADQLGPKSYRVVDYKTQRWAWSPDQLKKKPQARLYGLAAQIKWPDAEEIWVEFEFLRHGDLAVAGVRYTKDENKATWLWLKDLLKRIVDVPDTVDLASIETINDDCRWCVRKAGCASLKRNADVGGTAGLPLPDLIDRRALADQQIKALKALIEEADRYIETGARNGDVMELTTDRTRVTFARRNRREVDADRAAMILGAELFDQIGTKSLPMAEVDKLLKKKDTTLTPDQKRDLASVVTTKQGEPYVVTKPL